MTDEEKKAKNRERYRKYYENHKEKVQATQKRYLENLSPEKKEELRKYRADYYQQHKAVMDARAKAYIKAHPEKQRQYIINQAMKLMNQGGDE